MIKQGHVGTIELFSVVAIVQSITVFYNLPNVLAERAKTGAWLQFIFIEMAGLLLFIPVYLLLKKFPGKSIVEIAEDLLGKFGGLCLSTIVGGYYLYAFFHYLRVFSDTVINTMMLETPLPAIMVMAVLPPIVIAFLGLEALTRLALIFIPFISFGMFLIVGLSLPDLSYEAVYPLLGVPLIEHGRSALELAPVVTNTFFLAVWAPYFRKEKGIVSLVMAVFAIITVINTLLVIIVELNFPYPGTKLIPLPVFQAIRLIYLGRFIQRVEALFIIIAGIFAQIQMCTMFSTSVLAFAQGWKLTDWRPIIFPLAVMSFALSFVYHDVKEAATWYYSLPNSLIYASVTVLLPISIYILALFKGKKGREPSENPAA